MAAPHAGQVPAATLPPWRSVPYVRDQAAATVAALEEASVRLVRSAGRVLFVQDEPGAGLYLVGAGIVKISRLSADGREHIVHLAREGETFNDVCVLDGGPNPATAAALTDVVLWHVSREDLRRIAERRPELAWAMAGHMAGRARHLLGLVEDLAMRTVRGRLARLLLDESRSRDGDAVPRYLTQEEMASRLGTVREMVGRVLRSLAAAEIIQLDRHRIVILDVDRLSQEAGL